MYVMGSISKLPVKPVNVENDISFSFDDSIVVDKESQMQKYLLWVQAGILKPEYLLKQEGFSDQDIKEYMQTTPEVKPSLFPQE